ncbi:MAG: hypothetical protein NDJ89_01875 [Oligoflexia bacterium]|nr:hypothetical protein [Oligoflexia bacterium]
MKILLLAALVLAFSSGCQREARLVSTRQVVPGKTSITELTDQRGPPLRAAPLESRPGAETLSYPGNETFQAEQGKIVAHWRDPEPGEATLQYWRHRWKGQNPRYEEIAGTRDAHGNAEFLLRDSSSQTAVVYDPRRDRVLRVLRYGQ